MELSVEVVCSTGLTEHMRRMSCVLCESHMDIACYVWALTELPACNLTSAFKGSPYHKCQSWGQTVTQSRSVFCVGTSSFG